MKAHLYVCSHYQFNPFYVGLVDISDEGFVNGETPIEDYGMYFYGEAEFTGDISQAFMDLLRRQDLGDYDCEWSFAETEIGKYLAQRSS